MPPDGGVDYIINHLKFTVLLRLSKMEKNVGVITEAEQKKGFLVSGKFVAAIYGTNDAGGRNLIAPCTIACMCFITPNCLA